MTEQSRPRLAAKAKLRFDRRSGQFLLLYPERGLLLNETGSEVVHLCTGRLTVERIVDILARRHVETPREVIRPQVWAFLSRLHARRVVEA